ncbi:hypothetical protein [Sphingomonas sp. AX6]|uniref:hypothetical protein n=1 Tax=Sphingomonas sp. AX6 TaxID=2653171 RepID=UPI0012F16E3D|nr:hypothetical protein [Sphingomonas sp. AX6]VXC92984.1 conserved exported hypothetical protein [Sphingomonas sp. AX6]
MNVRLPVLLAASSLAFTTPAFAQSAPDVADLVGARAAGGETQLEARGYRNVPASTSTVRDSRFTFWWHPERRQCLSVATNEGRYATLNIVPPGNCGPAATADNRPAIRDDRYDRDPAFGRPPPPRPGYDERPSTLPGNAPSDTMVLVCYGEGNKPTLRNEPRYEWNRDRDRYEWAPGLVSGNQRFNADVQVELYGDHGRIHLARQLIPPINSGGSNGWWDITDLRVTRDRITGRYRLNGMNKPTIDIDRRSGRIFLDGIEDFRGTCDSGNWGGGRRF